MGRYRSGAPLSIRQGGWVGALRRVGGGGTMLEPQARAREAPRKFGECVTLSGLSAKCVTTPVFGPGRSRFLRPSVRDLGCPVRMWRFASEEPTLPSSTRPKPVALNPLPTRFSTADRRSPVARRPVFRVPRRPRPLGRGQTYANPTRGASQRTSPFSRSRRGFADLAKSRVTLVWFASHPCRIVEA